MNRENLYFNSLIKLKYLPECMNIERRENPNEILCIHRSELIIIIFTSLINRDINIKRRKDINNKNNNDFIKISKVILIG
tara:strand:- start:729 stop:968 length:240 start_codon:yes stop_codon:yes gene_type:complete